MAKRKNPKGGLTAEHAVKMQLKAFRRKFGRDPKLGEAVFFDPDAAEPRAITPEKMSSEILEALQASGMPPQFIYAFRKTGLLVTESNRHILPAEGLAEWQSAMDEYFALEDMRAGDERPASTADKYKAGEGPPPSEIPEFKGQPISEADHELVVRTLAAVDGVLSGPVSMRVRIETAAVHLAVVLEMASQLPVEDDDEEQAEERRSLFEYLTVMRARELFELGN